jgi:glucose/arabinose dehydrogenase
VDIAFVPDGRLLIAEESGRVMVLTADGRLLAEPALTLARGRAGDTRLLSVAVDPAFDRTHLVYAVYTTAAADGSRAFTLSRFTEAFNAIFGEIVLLDGVAASPSSSASVRVGADGKLFAAFDDGGDPRRAGDLASPSGKVLRLNADGTTPADQAGLTPTYATDLHSPRGFDWQPGSRVLWITDRRSDDSASLTAVGASAGAQRRGVRLAAYSLPRNTRPSSAAFLRGTSLPGLQNDLLIASAEGRHLLRVRFDRSSVTKVVSTERLLQDVVGSVRVVAVAPDAGLYIATDDAVAQISMAE